MFWRKKKVKPAKSDPRKVINTGKLSIGSLPGVDMSQVIPGRPIIIRMGSTKPTTKDFDLEDW
jgi:hypothetical protein